MPRRRKGDTSVATQGEVKDLRRDIEEIAKGTRKVKAGYDDILSTVQQITDEQKKDFRWLKETVDKEKELSKVGQSIVKMGTKRWWHTKSIGKSVEFIGIMEIRAHKESRKRLEVEDDLADSLSEQAENLYDGVGLASELVSAAGDLDGIFGGMGSTIHSFLTNPLTAVTALFETFMEMQTAIADQFGAMGMREFEGQLHEAHMSAVKLGYNFDEVASSAAILSSDFGLAFESSIGMNDNVMGIARATATGVDESAILVGMFTQLAGHSKSSATNLLLSAERLAVANKMAPGEILREVAGSTEQFALFAREGGENIIRAAIQSKKLGINLDTVGGIAKGLLNFQDSLNKEIEAGIILGQDINLQKARELALTGDLEGMMESVLDQLGGEYRWNELNTIQREAMADALGVDVLTMSKLVSKEKEAVSIQGKLAELQAENPIPEESITSAAELLYNLKAIGMELATTYGPQIEKIVKHMVSFVKWLGEGNNALSLLRGAMALYGAKLGMMLGQTVALMMANAGLWTTKVGAWTGGLGVPLAMAAAGGTIAWAMSNIDSAKNVGQMKSGGITTQEGLINMHPQEAVMPLEKIPMIMKEGMSPLFRELQKEQQKMREDMKAYFGDNGTAIRGIGSGVADNLVRAEGMI